MKWIRAKSVDDLKKLGKFREVKGQVQADLSKSIQIKARGWNDLFKRVSKLQEMSRIYESLSDIDNQQSTTSYFKTEATRYIYALVELSGESQLKELGINRIHFRDKKKAKTLRNTIAHEIHPDKCNHPRAASAMDELNDLFKEVIS